MQPYTGHWDTADGHVIAVADTIAALEAAWDAFVAANLDALGQLDYLSQSDRKTLWSTTEDPQTIFAGAKWVTQGSKCEILHPVFFSFRQMSKILDLKKPKNTRKSMNFRF